MASQTRTWRRWKACNGRCLAAGVTTKVGWVFRGEGCTSLLERRTEVKGWEVGIMLAFPKGPNCIAEFRDSYIQGSVWGLELFIRDLGGEVRLQQDVLGPDSVSQPRQDLGCGGYNLENDPEMCCHYQQVNPIPGYIRRNGAIQFRELLSPSTLACWAAPGTRCPISGSTQQDRRRQGNSRGFSWKAVKMFCDLQQMFWDLWGEGKETGRVVFFFFFGLAERRVRCILIAACYSLKGSFKGDRAKLFLVVQIVKKGGKGKNLCLRRIRISKNSLKRLVWYWYR